MDEPARRSIDPLHTRCQRVVAGALGPPRELHNAMAYRGAIRRRCGCGRGRRRCADIGDEIADREIGLVTNAGDDGKHGLIDGARDNLLVEGP